MKVQALILPLGIALGFVRPAYCGEWQGLSGQHSGIAVFRAVIIDNQDSWQRLWAEHRGSLEGMPEVDFSRERVAGVFLGLRHTGGNSVKLDVAAAQDGIVVSYEIKTPGGFAAEVMSAPFALLKVPAAPIRMVASGREANSFRALKSPALQSRLGESSKRLQGLQDKIDALKNIFD